MGVSVVLQDQARRRRELLVPPRGCRVTLCVSGGARRCCWGLGLLLLPGRGIRRAGAVGGAVLRVLLCVACCGV